VTARSRAAPPLLLAQLTIAVPVHLRARAALREVSCLGRRVRFEFRFVLSRAEVARLLEQVEPTFAPMVALLYGAVLRLMECLRLRVKDVNFDRKILIVREGKGRKDRVVMLPEPFIIPLRRQLEHSRTLWAEDRACRVPSVAMPEVLAPASFLAPTHVTLIGMVPRKSRLPISTPQ
jgi:integrase